MKISPRHAAIAFGMAGLMTVLGAWLSSPGREATAAPAAPAPLDRVSADSAVLIHGRASDLWNHPLVADLRKQFAGPLEKSLGDLEKMSGLTADQLDTVTLHFPKMPAGPGDENLFIVQVVTKTPYDKTKLLAGLRGTKAEIKGDVVAIAGPFRLHFTAPTQFTVLHESLLADFVKGPGKATDGPLAGAITAAREPANTLTFGIDPSKLPNEIFTAAPPELQPFLPLVKSKSIVLTVNTEKALVVTARFAAGDADKAQEAVRSLELAKKLAVDSFGVLSDKFGIPEDALEIMKLLREVTQSVKDATIVRTGSEASATISIASKADLRKAMTEGIGGIRQSAARLKSANNLKQLALAIHNYHDTYATAPPAAICDKKGKPLLSWRVAVLPFVEGENLHRQFKLDEPWDSEHNKKLIEKIPPVYVLPSEEGKSKGETHYLAFVGNGAVFDTLKGFKLAQIPDGTSNTILFAEAAKSVPWTKPEDTEYDPKKPVMPLLRFEKDQCQVGFADGSVRVISNKNEEKIWHWLVQTADGNPLPKLK